MVALMALRFVRRKGLFGITWGTPGAGTFESSWLFDHGLPLSPSSSMDQPYAKHPVVAVAISTLCEDAASVPWEVFPSGNSDDKIEDHPLIDFMERPNPHMTGHQMWVGTYLSMKLFGEAFWWFPQLSIGRPGGLRATRRASGGLTLLDPRAMRADTQSGSVAWTLRTNNREVALDEDSLVQFKRPNPYDPVRGLSELQSLLMEVEGDAAASAYNKRFFGEQGGVPSGFLIPHENDATTAEARRVFAERFNRSHESGRRFVAVVPPGWKWQDIGIAPRDMEFKALREYSREQILSVFGVPPFMAGVLEKASHWNAREQREMYWLGTITRFLTSIQQTINAEFLPKAGIDGVRLFPAWEQVKALTENLDEKVAVAQKLFAMGWSKRAINERLELGMDVDDLNDADVGYLPWNVVPVDSMNEPRQPMTQPGTAQTEDQPDDESTRSLVRALPEADADERRRTLIWRNLVTRYRDIEITFDGRVRRHFKDIEQEVLSNIQSIKGWRAVRTKAEGDVDDLLFNLVAFVRKLIDLTKPLHAQAIKRGGETIVADIGSAISFDMTDPRVIATLATLSGKIKGIDETIETALRDSLTEGLAEGESVNDLAKRVREVMHVARGRSMTIARTEVGRAFNSGRHIAMQDAGVREHEWMTSRDVDVRDLHQKLDGVKARVGETFIDRDNTDTGMMFPQDPEGSAEQVINCRCVALPVIRGTA